MEDCGDSWLNRTVSVEVVEVPFQEEVERDKMSEAEGEQVTRSIIRMAPPLAPAPVPPPPPIKHKEEKKRRNCTVENCNYSTPYSKDLARHMRKHTGEKPFRCDRCSKSYSRYDKLVIHIRVHENVRPFKCESCEYTAVDSGALRKHQRTHSQERPYKCQLCPYAAKDSSQLVVHLRSHTQDSPYFCMEDECDAAFKTPSDLQRHARTHTGEKPYSCSQCSYRAAVKSNLNVHLRKHHLNETDSDTMSSSNISTTDKKQSSLLINNATNHHEPGNLNVNSCIQYAYNYHGEISGSSKEDPLPSNVNPASVVQMDESETEVPVPLTSLSKHNDGLAMCKKLIKSLNSSRTEDVRSSSSLPFQYACKQCSYKADTLKMFAVHMKKVHEDSGASNELLKSKLVPGKVGRPRPRRRTKGSSIGSCNELERFYDCSLCSASFVRQDSLRCHMRQHADPSDPRQSKAIHHQANHETVVGNVIYNTTYPNYCFQTPSSSSNTRSEGLNISVPVEVMHASEEQEGLLEATDIELNQGPSVITENIGVINSSVSPPQQLYIISPGGTIQTIEHGDFIQLH